MNNLILIATGFAVVLGAEGIFYLFRYRGEAQRAQLRSRLQSLSESTDLSLLREQRMARSPAVARLLRAIPGTDALERLLLQTDLTWTVGSMLLGGLLSGAVLVTAALLVAPGASVLPLLGLAVGLIAPMLIASSSRTKRSQALSEQLPDALDMIVRSLRAGHGAAAGFKLVATEMPPPVAVEFGRCFEEQNVGLEFRQAIHNMTKRMPDNVDLKIFAVSMVVQYETGGNMIEILEQIAHTVRQRFRFYGKLKALVAEAKSSMVVLGALPIVSAVGMTIMNPEYMNLLYTDPIGHMILGISAALWLTGVAAMQALAKVDF